MQKRALETMDRATFLNEETLFERQNDALNEIEKLLERCRNHSDGVHGDHIFYSVDLTEENVLSLPKWEFHSFCNIGASMQRGQCDHEKIKAASYDIDGLSNVNSEQFRGLLSEAKFEDFLEGIEIDLSPLSVGLCFDIVGNKRIDFLSLAFGPFDL